MPARFAATASLFLMLVAASLAHAAETSASTNAVDANAFKLITDRNIFNPNRRAGRSEASTPRPARQVRTESLSLQGTLIHEHGSVAFFEGSQTGRKALKLSDSIAGFRITEIDWGHVKLASNDQEIELPVGGQMTKREAENWRMSEGSGASQTSSSAPSSSSGSEDDELVRKLMEKRAREAGEPVNTDPATETEDSPPPPSESAPDDGDDLLQKLIEKRAQEIDK